MHDEQWDNPFGGSRPFPSGGELSDATRESRRIRRMQLLSPHSRSRLQFRGGECNQWGERKSDGRARGDPPLTKAAIDDAGAAQTSPSVHAMTRCSLLRWRPPRSHFLSPFFRPISGIIKDGMVTSLKLIHFHTFPKQIHNQNLLPGLQPRPSGLQLLRCTACSLQQTRFGRGPRTVILGRGGEAP